MTDTASATAVTVPLQPGEWPCADCGVAVGPPHQHREEVPTFGRADDVPLAADLTRPPTLIEMTLCSACAARHGRAAVLTEEFPAVTRRIGSASLATAQVAAALAVPEVMGRPAPAVTDAAALRALLRHFLAAGAACRWAAGFTPRMLPGRSPGVATAARWAAVGADAELREEMARATSNWLAARIGRTREVPPPSGGACGLCGIATQPVRPGQHPGAVWHGPYRWPRSGLGTRGRRGQEVVEVHLCGACEDAFARNDHVIGAGLLERAYRAALGIPQRGPEPVALDGLTGWAATDRRPNEEPWQHARLDDESRANLGID